MNEIEPKKRLSLKYDGGTMMTAEHTAKIIKRLNDFLRTSLPASYCRNWFARRSGLSPQILFKIMTSPPKRLSVKVAEKIQRAIDGDDIRAICLITQTESGFYVAELDREYSTVLAALIEAYAAGYTHASPPNAGIVDTIYIYEIIKIIEKDKIRHFSIFKIAKKILETHHKRASSAL
jgi:hypothetical protein